MSKEALVTPYKSHADFYTEGETVHDITELAKQLGNCPDDLWKAVNDVSRSAGYGPVKKLQGQYGEVHATTWAVAKLLLEKMLELAKRLKEDDPPQPLLVNLLTGLLERGGKFWVPTKPEPGMPGFSKSANKAKSTNGIDFQNASEAEILSKSCPLTAVAKAEILAQRLVKNAFANTKAQNTTIEAARCQIWDSHAELLRDALREHHDKATSPSNALKKGNGTGLSAIAKCDALAKEMRLHSPELTIEECRGNVWTMYPNLLEEYDTEFHNNLPRNVGN